MSKKYPPSPPQLRAAAEAATLPELQALQIRIETQHEALIEAHIGLKEARDRLVDFYEFAPVGYLTVTDKGLIADINQTGAALLGRERDDLLHEPFARFVEPEDVDGWHLHLVGTLKTDERRSCELELRVDGPHVDVRLDSVRLIKDGQTPVLRVVLTDITKLKQAEAGLLSTKIQLQATLDAIPDLMFEVGLDGRIYDYHSCRTDLLAAPPEAFHGKLFSEVLPPDVAETCVSAIGEASDKGWSIGRQYALSLPQGKRWFELSVAPKQGTENQAKRFIFVARDITERKHAEEVSREGEARYQRAVNGANDGIWEWTLATGENYMSPRWKQMLGYEDHELPNMLASFAAHLHPDDKARVMERRRAHFEERKPYEVEMRLRCKSGEYRWFYSRGQATWDENGQAVIMSGSITDITGRREAEAELEKYRDHLEELVSARTSELAQSRDDAEAANRAKSIFLANMSHELRTPMNGVMGMIDLVLSRASDPRQIDWLNKSKSSAKHLLDVINDILDLSKIESDLMVLEKKDFSLSQAIDNVMSMQAAAAFVKGLRLSHEIDTSLPDIFCGDVLRLKQILLNFVGNAVKFSDQGKITVRAHAMENADTGVLLRIEVTDQGIGISLKDQKRLFHAFTQADDSMTRKYGGTGLGLIISKRLALLMGGDVGVESAPGMGSTFWFTARLTAGATQPVVSEPEAIISDSTIIKERYFSHRILVVDDEPINREVARLHLEDIGLIVDAAEDGAEAVAMAKTGSYAAIFMDMQMPKVNGLEATRQIRQLPKYREIPIIAMTANVFDEDKALCIAAGMNDFLAKPFTPAELFTILLRSLN